MKTADSAGEQPSRQHSRRPLASAALAPGLRFLGWLLIAAAVILAFRAGLALIQDKTTPRILAMLIATGLGVAGVWLFYWTLDRLVALLPVARLRRRLLPLVFAGPALAMVFIYLVYPAALTIYLSFHDARSEHFVGLENYRFVFTEPAMRTAFANNIFWIIMVTSASVALGLIIAVLFDRVRYESVAKSLIFLPTAISFVGASVIWKFVYAYQPKGRPQIGLLNALVVQAGGEPVGWLIERGINNLALMVVMIWLQTGFCMVVLSAALKAIPDEIIDAARIDGASELQIFFSIVIPTLRGAIMTVATAVVIAVLKVFDIVYVMTNGQYSTEVIANRMYAEMFRYRDYGRASALAVILLLAVVPVIIANVRNIRRQRS